MFILDPRIRILIFYPSRILDLEVKKAPDPGSATMVLFYHCGTCLPVYRSSIYVPMYFKVTKSSKLIQNTETSVVCQLSHITKITNKKCLFQARLLWFGICSRLYQLKWVGIITTLRKSYYTTLRHPSSVTTYNIPYRYLWYFTACRYRYPGPTAQCKN